MHVQFDKVTLGLVLFITTLVIVGATLGIFTLALGNI